MIPTNLALIFNGVGFLVMLVLAGVLASTGRRQMLIGLIALLSIGVGQALYVGLYKTSADFLGSGIVGTFLGLGLGALLGTLRTRSRPPRSSAMSDSEAMDHVAKLARQSEALRNTRQDGR